jgi:hypothetical protein
MFHVEIFHLHTIGLALRGIHQNLKYIKYLAYTSLYTYPTSEILYQLYSKISNFLFQKIYGKNIVSNIQHLGCIPVFLSIGIIHKFFVININTTFIINMEFVDTTHTARTKIQFYLNLC